MKVLQSQRKGRWASGSKRKFESSGFEEQSRAMKGPHIVRGTMSRTTWG
jgi:hypothetical protein